MPTVFLEPHVPSCPITITSFSYIYTSTAFWIKFNLYWKFLIFSLKRYWLSVYSPNVDYNNLEVVIVKQGLFIKTEHVKIIEYDFKVLVLMWTPVIWLTENFINTLLVSHRYVSPECTRNRMGFQSCRSEAISDDNLVITALPPWLVVK